MAFTSDCVATSLEPATTRALPLAACNSLAAIMIDLAATSFTPFGVADEPLMALYKAISAGPSSDGLIGMRTSALVPVKLIPVSNWICLDIFLLSSDLAPRFETYC